MLSKLLAIACCLWPVVLPAADGAMSIALRQLLTERGAQQPVFVTLSERAVTEHPELVVTNASVRNETAILILRCRHRSDCGEAIAGLHYRTHDEATAAAKRMTATSRLSRTPPVVRAGEKVFLELQSPRLKMRLPVRALSAGRVGDYIRVRDMESKKIHLATVVGPQAVRSEQ